MKKLLFAVIFTLCVFLQMIMFTTCQAASVTLAWDASPDPVTGYTVYRSTAPITDSSSPEWRDTGKVTQYVWPDIPQGISYYRLKAYNTYGRSGYSNEVSYTPPSTSSSVSSTTTTTACGGCGQPPCATTTSSTTTSVIVGCISCHS